MSMRRTLATAALTAVLLVLAAACGEDSEPLSAGSPAVDEEAVPSAATCLEGTTDCQDTPLEPLPQGDEMPEPKLVEVTPGATLTGAMNWDVAKPMGDGSTLLVEFWGGAAPCFVVADVRAVESADRVVVGLDAGVAPGAEDVGCPQAAERMAVRVELSEPLGDRVVVDELAEAQAGSSAP